MTKKQMQKRIEHLEAQVALLTAQVAKQQRPVVVPAPPNYWWHPAVPYRPTITCDTTNGGSEAALRVRLRSVS